MRYFMAEGLTHAVLCSSSALTIQCQNWFSVSLQLALKSVGLNLMQLADSLLTQPVEKLPVDTNKHHRLTGWRGEIRWKPNK